MNKSKAYDSLMTDYGNLDTIKDNKDKLRKIRDIRMDHMIELRVELENEERELALIEELLADK